MLVSIQTGSIECVAGVDSQWLHGSIACHCMHARESTLMESDISVKLFSGLYLDASIV